MQRLDWNHTSTVSSPTPPRRRFRLRFPVRVNFNAPQPKAQDIPYCLAINMSLSYSAREMTTEARCPFALGDSAFWPWSGHPGLHSSISVVLLDLQVEPCGERGAGQRWASRRLGGARQRPIVGGMIRQTVRGQRRGHALTCARGYRNTHGR